MRCLSEEDTHLRVLSRHRHHLWLATADDVGLSGVTESTNPEDGRPALLTGNVVVSRRFGFLVRGNPGYGYLVSTSGRISSDIDIDICPDNDGIVDLPSMTSTRVGSVMFRNEE